MGELDEAQALLEGVERECEQSGASGQDWMKWRYTQHLHAGLGELWLARGDLDRALAYAEKCIAGAPRTGVSAEQRTRT